jgi:ATP-dependent Clp protease ATP-binding subunit ClpC
MSEFHDRYTVSRLVGAPPGYVGYDEGGQLTEKVRRKPFSVVLFDEVEKAHPDVFNTLLQVLEDGRLTDGQGRIVDFKNTVLILTTNLGTRDIAKAVSLGFSAGNDAQSDYERMKNKVTDELKQHFRPEFLNRIDDIIVFHQLTPEEIVEIVDIMLTRVDAQLKNKDMGLELTQSAKQLLAKKGWDPGARRPAAAPDDPARYRGPLLREDPLRRAGRRPTSSWWTPPGRATRPSFTFRGEPKPAPVPGHAAGRRHRRGAAAEE